MDEVLNSITSICFVASSMAEIPYSKSGGGGLRICEYNILLWVLAHSHVGGFGGMHPNKVFFEFGFSVGISDAYNN